MYVRRELKHICYAQCTCFSDRKDVTINLKYVVYKAGSLVPFVHLAVKLVVMAIVI